VSAKRSHLPSKAPIRKIRGAHVLLDADLAALYGVTVKALNQAVRRNRSRFPADFVFQLDEEESAALRSQIVTSKRGGRRYRPFAFSEQGVAMLSSVLRSRRAIGVNVEIMRAFVRLRRMALSHEDLTRRIDTLERRYDGQFAQVFEALRALTRSGLGPRRRIGF
jgi:hypothetical protein